MLHVSDLITGYGQSQALFGVSFEIAQGEMVTLLGRNGMGKTTTVRSLMGLTPAWSGSVVFNRQEISHLPTYRIARVGLGLVPEGRQIFPNLTVEENLVATAASRFSASPRWTLNRIYELFPRLYERLRQGGNNLSGGEQQMLAIARALMTNPHLLILDEACEGLAPLVRQEIWTCLQTLKSEGESVLLIDKNLQALLKIADRHYIMDKGCIVWTGNSQALAADASIQRKYLGV